MILVVYDYICIYVYSKSQAQSKAIQFVSSEFLPDQPSQSRLSLYPILSAGSSNMYIYICNRIAVVFGLPKNLLYSYRIENNLLEFWAFLRPSITQRFFVSRIRIAFISYKNYSSSTICRFCVVKKFMTLDRLTSTYICIKVKFQILKIVL